MSSMNKKKWYVFVSNGKYPCTTLGKTPSFSSSILALASEGKKVPLDVSTVYEFELDQDRPGNLHSIYNYDNLFLMSEKLLKTLQGAGVTNLEIFNAIFKDTTGTTHTDYMLVNILGSSSAINKEKSTTFDQTLGEKEDDVFGPLGYDDLSIDENAAEASGLLLFHLADSGHTLIAHESLKKPLLDAGIEDIEFIEPEDWAGA